MTVLAVTPDILRQGRETLDGAFKIMRTQDSRYGPPQPPLDELYGTTFTPEMVGDMGREPFGEDVFSIDQRVRAAKWLLAAYETNRKRPVYPPVWFKPGLYVLSGDMGDGKTLGAVSFAVLWMMCGWPSFSANGGLCFGKSLIPAQVYVFPEFLTRGSICVADELHAIYGRYEGQSVRGRTMAQGTAAFRKERIYAFGATAREWMLGGDLKAAVRGIGYPFEMHPRSKRIAPPWAYKGIKWYYPDPWRGTQYRELHDKEDQHREPCERYTQTLHPYSLFASAAHYNSWEKITLDYGGDLGASKFRNALSGRDGDAAETPSQLDSYRGGPTDEAIGLAILRWYEEGVFDAETDAYNQTLAAGRATDRGEMLLTIDSLAARFTQESGFKLGASRLRRGLASAGVKHSSRNVNVEALAEAYGRQSVAFGEAALDGVYDDGQEV